MICKACKRTIEDDSIFCRFCGQKCIRTREKKKDVKIPTPRKLPSGSYFSQITVNGKRVSLTAPTEREWIAQAKALKLGLIKLEEKPETVTLEACLNAYVDKRVNVLSPSTVRGYHTIISTRFRSYMSRDVNQIDFQKMVNDELLTGISTKTLVNAWRFVVSCLNDMEIKFKAPSLPQVVKKELPWLDYQQIEQFMENGIRGFSCELGALLALHGLRKSELLAVTPAKVRNGCIHVQGAVVRSDDGFILKDSNKNQSSVRTVPIFIPRLQELIDAADCNPDEPLVKMHPDRLYDRINEACNRAGVPQVGIHGLRRSFASLCVHMGVSELSCQKLGGWADYKTMHSIYMKLADADKQRDVETLKGFFANDSAN